jgi:thioredoxin reductase
VDIVIVGADADAVATALAQARAGQRVLIVVRARRSALVGRLRRAVREAGRTLGGRVAILTGAEVVCVDGVRSVEAVVMRDIRSGRLVAVNASAIVFCDNRTPKEAPCHP